MGAIGRGASSAIFVALLVCCSARAQTRSDAAPARPLALALLPFAAARLDPELAAPPSFDRDLHVRQRRGRFMIAVGTGAIAAALFHAVLMSQWSGCGDDSSRPAISYGLGALVGTLGLGLALGGGRRLTTVPPEQRRRASPGRKVGMAAVALGTFATAELVMTSLSVMDRVCYD